MTLQQRFLVLSVSATTTANADNEIRVANFMDSRLTDLAEKGTLAAAGRLYNPDRIASLVVHCSPYPDDAVLRQQLAAAGINLVCYDPRPWHPFRAVADLVRLFIRVRRDRINLIRGRMPYTGSLIGCCLGWMLGIPTVVSLGGDNRISQELTGHYYFGSRTISFAIEKFVLRLCNRIIVPNRFTANYVRTIIGDRAAEKCTVIPWAIDEVGGPDREDARLREQFSLDPDARIVPVFGYLNRYKFTDVLFQAIDGWQASGARLMFVFCGDGPLRAEGEKRFAGRPDVRFIGWQPRAVVHALMRAAAFVLVPMSGFVLLEAASAGCAVVTARLEWHGELVRDGIEGILVNPTDPLEWRRAVAALASDPHRAKKLGRALQQHYLREYRSEHASAKEAALYRELTQRAGEQMRASA